MATGRASSLDHRLNAARIERPPTLVEMTGLGELSASLRKLMRLPVFRLALCSFLASATLPMVIWGMLTIPHYAAYPPVWLHLAVDATLAAVFIRRWREIKSGAVAQEVR